MQLSLHQPRSYQIQWGYSQGKSTLVLNQYLLGGLLYFDIDRQMLEGQQPFVFASIQGLTILPKSYILYPHHP